MKMRSTSYRFLLLALLALSGFACSKPNRTEQLSHDFYVTEVSDDFSSRFEDKLFQETPAKLDSREACEVSLKQAVCETTAGTPVITRNPLAVQCSPDSSKYVPALMEIFDETPEKMRLSLCSLEKIFISDAITSTAFASALTNGFGEIVGGYVGFKKGTFVEQPSTHDLVSWKEQLAFGGSTVFLANDPSLVQISYDLKMTTLKKDGLFYVLMHELGHLIDFNNQVNSRFAPTGWSRLSWKTADTPLDSARFAHQEDFCFYDCSSYLKREQGLEIYTSLRDSAFMTSYAGQNNYEDFAEFWAWHLMLGSKDPKFEITIPGETTIDLMPAFAANPKLKAKLDFVDQLWNSASLKIDNRK
jgi:hypothetical protein